MIRFFVSSVAVALALAASAEAAPRRPATPQEVAAARSAADAALAQANALDLFVNSSEGGFPRVTHLRSGFSCGLGETSTSKIVVLDAPGPRGEAFACEDARLSMPERFTVRHMPGVGRDAAFAAAVKAFLAEHPDAKPYNGPMLALSFKADADPLKDSKTARFVYLGANGAEFIRLGLIVVDGWVVEHRGTGKPDDVIRVELFSNITFGAAVTGMRRDHPAGNP